MRLKVLSSYVSSRSVGSDIAAGGYDMGKVAAEMVLAGPCMRISAGSAS